MRLRQSMADALKAALKSDGLRRVRDDQPGSPPWPAHPLTLHALVRRGYLTVTESRTRKGWPVTIWRITDDGRRALEPKTRIRRDVVLSMRAKGRATTLIPVPGGFEQRSVPEPEKVDPHVVAALPSTLEARQRWQREQLDKQRAREAMPLGEIVEREIASAQAAGVDTSEYEESVLRRMRALRNRARRAAA